MKPIQFFFIKTDLFSVGQFYIFTDGKLCSFKYFLAWSRKNISDWKTCQMKFRR